MYIKYWILSYTWGIIMNIFGLIGAVIMKAQGKKASFEYGRFIYRTGKNWGAISLGNYIFMSEDSSENTRNHEIGHTIQNIIYGPAFLFVIGIWSFLRASYRTIVVKLKIKTYADLPPYDSIWFEGDATKRGTNYVKKVSE